MRYHGAMKKASTAKKTSTAKKATVKKASTAKKVSTAKRPSTKKKYLSLRDASILAVLVQVPEGEGAKSAEAKQRLVRQLSDGEARQIGRAVVAGKRATFSRGVWETALELRRWKEKADASSSAKAVVAGVE